MIRGGIIGSGKFDYEYVFRNMSPKDWAVI
jgi:hypothetical protein